jgi:c(7)-type cytochrome triheme protein
MDRWRNFSANIRQALVALVAVVAALGHMHIHAQEGLATYEKTCAACHAKAVGGAPRSDDSAAWQVRLAKNGYSGLFDSAIKGKGAMPPKGGNVALSDEQVMSAVMYILRLAASGPTGAASVPAAKAPTSASVAKVATPSDVSSSKGRSTYQASCSACHATGAAGAPKLGDAAAWESRINSGVAALHNSALKGKGAMPAKGGNASLADADVKAAVDFMVAQSRGGATASAVAATPEAKEIVPARVAGPSGKAAYQAACATCHTTGIAGAPKLGDQAAWAPRVKAGSAALYVNAIKGKGAMPAKGGNAALQDAEVKSAVDFMLAQLGTGATAKTTSPEKPDAGAIVATAPAPSPSPSPSPVPARVAEVTSPSSAASAGTATAVSGVNTFNRLLQAPGKRNLPPLEDGIHDAANEATGLLQAPLHAYATLPKSNAGNRVDWVKALNEKKLSPRADKQDLKAEMAVLDLNIVREVKGSMPDVVFPHRQHTQWLDCSNCHPSIFIPQKGANQMSMASIMLGQKCGVCHGTVAFPISECRLCHSKSKEPAASSAGVKP